MNCTMTNNTTSVFPRNISLMVKGVAILMMIAHHCFAFPSYWLDSFCVSPFWAELCNQFKICVAVFAFITGYGFFAGKHPMFTDSLGKIPVFLGQYWMQLFLVFLPVASIGFSFSAKRILYNMFALYDNIILFAWYVFFHCLVMLTFPLVKSMLRKSLAWNLGIVLLGGYCITVILYFQPFDSPLATMLLDCSIYYPVVGVGYLVAKHSLFDRISEKLTHKIPVALLMILIVLLLRVRFSVVKGFSLDTVYAPILTLSLSWILKKYPILQSGLAFLGKHSFHMWLFHSIFFSAYTRNVVQPLVLWSDIPIIRFLVITVLSTGAACVIDALWMGLVQTLHKCKKENLPCT